MPGDMRRVSILKHLYNARKPVDSAVCLSLMRAEVLARFDARCFFLDLPSRGIAALGEGCKVDVCVVPCPRDLLLAARRRYGAITRSCEGGGGSAGGRGLEVELADLGGGGGNDAAGGSGAGEAGAAASASSSSVEDDPAFEGSLGRVHPTEHVQEGVPAVIFCNPNAGLYECANMSPKSSDWITFYQSLGFQVVLFNYRGESSLPLCKKASEAKKIYVHQIRSRSSSSFSSTQYQ